ncbi:tetraacyldisaccharide 4'-kinase [Bartonella bacilliformis str. Heidi Mejia]|uniref:tetraacyldisaccharide 4'-kinase n=1 Tax=Bartonella bacilliformis TaxID=774 RepID=UPI00044B229B|nr:tetraacyldisaccharide 4'-kinase [Bartonella bacilliformis]EYS90988.1 tetraacyldisaccharide 4'-kinase [Bartonella bacilliformis str. Heidi Mejia]KEG15693.1 tetraacyldisaccharide 4'-kinase [Bartonella bacilliformis Cond044]KEG17898.1 tetraacyldisaccharide 4'-kinase [Bartonella bacilliformis Hosp800-02]KEG21819.1 tetraacyldisaccharide 4'-kinase [Bartonella bacilliformis VAB9028]KEG23194.1 tetraacyldisaccharide 4'-kinase [Bartonella bacilliformis CAR600-02]
MYISAPHFWWKNKSFLRFLLTPFSKVYGYCARRGMERKPPVIDLPVLCVGNFTLGGAGKTPVVIVLSQAAKKLGLKPGVVSRGYGRTVKGVHLVDVECDDAYHVGDEPLLLARHALVAISPDRYAAAKRLKEEGCDLILMDDGFQSRRLYMDYALLVVDAMRGLGNGAVFPAGPLRAPLETQLSLMDSVLCIGHLKACNHVDAFITGTGKSLHYAHLKPLASDEVSGKSFLAFAGIGNPDKFFESIEEISGHVIETCSYPDHYFFTDADLKNLKQKAKIQNLWLATTAKDYTRIQAKALQKDIENLIVFDVTLDFAQADFCYRLLEEVIARFKKRKHSL